MRAFRIAGFTALLIGAAAFLQANNAAPTLVVTSSNAANNQLLVYDTSGKLVQSIATQGKGGAGGNAGGIAARGDLLAVVNFGSNNVSLFSHAGNGFQFRHLVPAVPGPVSVAFGHGHMYILGAMKIESHQVFGSNVNTNPDGTAALVKADGSSAQVGVLPNELIVTEKSNLIETVALRSDGSVAGSPAVTVQNIPSNVNAPFGLVTRGNDAYVTIAHADEISLVRNGAVLTTTPSVTQHAPCWLGLEGPFLYSSNSPSMTISRYAVYGRKIVQDAAVAASLAGTPTDIDVRGGVLGVIDATAASVTNLSVYAVDEDGNLKLTGSATIPSAANGMVVLARGAED